MLNMILPSPLLFSASPAPKLPWQQFVSQSSKCIVQCILYTTKIFVVVLRCIIVIVFPSVDKMLFIAITKSSVLPIILKCYHNDTSHIIKVPIDFEYSIPVCFQTGGPKVPKTQICHDYFSFNISAILQCFS